MSFKQLNAVIDKAQVTDSKESLASRIGGLEGAGPMDGPVFRTTLSYNGQEYKTKTQNVQFMMGEHVPIIILEAQTPEILYDKITPGNVETPERMEVAFYRKKTSLFGGGKIKKMKKAMLAGTAGQRATATIIGRDARDGTSTEVNGRKISATIVATLTVLVETSGEKFLAHVTQKIKWKAKDESEFFRLGAGTAVGNKVDVIFDPDNKSNVVIAGLPE